MKTSWKLAAAAVAMAAVSANVRASEVEVLTAWYGQSCGAAHANVTARVKSTCDRKEICSYYVDAGILGDPAPGCAKNMVVLFACRGQQPVRLAQLPAEAHNQMMTLSCAPAPASK